MYSMKCALNALMVTLVLSAVSAQAKTIACWNSYSRYGSQPVLTARVLKNNKIEKIKVSELAYKAYSQNPSISSAVLGKEILTNENQFKGKREFCLNRGAKLILPLKLSKADLEKANLNKNQYKKSNGLLMLPTKIKNSKEYTFLPMTCQENI